MDAIVHHNSSTETSSSHLTVVEFSLLQLEELAAKWFPTICRKEQQTEDPSNRKMTACRVAKYIIGKCQSLSFAPFKCLVCKDARGKALGFTILKKEEVLKRGSFEKIELIKIELLCSHPDATGLGAGSKLLSATAWIAHSIGIDTLNVHSAASAQSFYEKHGFTANPRTPQNLFKEITSVNKVSISKSPPSINEEFAAGKPFFMPRFMDISIITDMLKKSLPKQGPGKLSLDQQVNKAKSFLLHVKYLTTIDDGRYSSLSVLSLDDPKTLKVVFLVDVTIDQSASKSLDAFSKAFASEIGREFNPNLLKRNRALEALN